VVLLDLPLAKGLEFDQVIIPDAQAALYGDDAISRHRLYTAISRATQKVTILAQGELTPLL
jgi:DNA helicase-2/ATP-dependent DNA helicase PcrA